MLAVLDSLAVFSSFLLAKVIAVRVELFGASAELAPIPETQFLFYAGLSALFAVILMAWQGTYHPSTDHMKLDGDRRFIRSIIMLVGFIFIPFFYAQTKADSRELLTIAALLIPILLILEKTLAVAFLSKHFDKPLRTRKLLIIGSEHEGPYVLRQALSCWQPGYLPVGFLSSNGLYSTNGSNGSSAGSHRQNGNGNGHANIETESRGLVGSAPILGDYADLEKTLKRHAVQEVWINDPEMKQEKLIEVLSHCEERGIMVSMLPSIGRIPTMSVTAAYAGSQVLLRERKVQERIYYDKLKRAIDFVFSTLFMILLLPVFALIGLWVKLDSPGPIFFKQERVGRNGRVFKMFKFRSMYVNAPQYAVSPSSKHDPRITRAGRFLRKTSLDELPQLINVFRGEMSLVGPRPEMPFIVEKYTRFQRARLQVKPGITGLWQLSADRSIAIHDNLDYDLYYIQNRSMTTDIVILWRTLWFAIRGI